MYLMYVDESGDTGLSNSPSNYFALSGIVVHELKWRDLVNDLLSIRKYLKSKYGIGMREEIHAAEFLRRSHPTALPKNIRLQILRDNIRGLSGLDYISITNIVISKQGKPAGYDVFGNAWRALFQRFENTLNYKNFPGPANSQDQGIVFCDDTSGKKLNQLIRRMAVYNPIPNMGGTAYRQLPLRAIIEDPNMRNSKESLPVQAADICAFMLYQHIDPNAYVRKKTGHGFFHVLKPILNTRASNKNPFGIVML
ncbi:MAG: DUF3800 domain-containing protein [Alphaproteobacteria bacterium]|nr:DUF3800 domain-containing protein [Alphaproteobacteria bacterium]